MCKSTHNSPVTQPLFVDYRNDRHDLFRGIVRLTVILVAIRMACDDMLTMILLFREKSVYLWLKPLEGYTGRRSIAAATPMMTKKYEPGYSNNRRSMLI